MFNSRSTLLRRLRPGIWGAVLVLALLSPLGCILHCHALNLAASGTGVFFCDPAKAASHGADQPVPRPSLRAFYETLLHTALVLPALAIIRRTALSHGPTLRQRWLPPPTPPPRSVW